MWFSAVQLTIVGMGIVLVFLVLMVFLINFTGMIINKYFPEKIEEAENIKEDVLIAVVAAAITSNR